MTNPKIIEEAPISIVELGKEIEKIKKRDGELNFRAQKCQEYLQQVKVLKPAKAEELEKEINSLNIPRLKKEHVIKLIDALPVTVDEVKNLFQNEAITITQENLKKIADTVKKYA